MEEKLPPTDPNEKKDGTKDNGPSKEEMQNVIRKFWLFAIRTLSIRDGADIEATTEGIRKDIDFKGPNVWILICSIIIASVGLNVNSAAAIIGAMLISPLMGPILGVGLAIGTNDWKMLSRSIKGLSVAVIVSLITSTLYFAITPLAEVQSEILARTKPTSLDVLIALFGGIAGIVAGSRKEKTNVIPGVAIATALMPPLCTAGFGLATGNLSYFFGAFYLFLINSVFIALSTFLIVRYLRFPIVHFVDPKKEKKYRRYLIITVIVVIVPSIYISYTILKESRFRLNEDRFSKNAELYVDENMELPGADVVNVNYEYSDTGVSVIEVFVIGEKVSTEKQAELNSKLADYDLKKTRVKILQDGSGSSVGREDLLTKLEESYRNQNEVTKSKDQMLMQKDAEIEELLTKLAKFENKSVDFEMISKEIRIQYPEADRFSYATALEDNGSGLIDTLPTLMVSWKPTVPQSEKVKRTEQMKMWLQVRLKSDSVRVMPY